MNKILIVGALSREINVIKKEIKKLKLINVKINFLTVGVGNFNMILNFTKFLMQKPNFDFIINIGVCGYKKEKEDFIQVARIFNISNNSELITPYIINFGKLSSIITSEKIIYNSDELEGEKYVDMESYGFEKVCENFNIPRVIFKIPVDKIGEETRKFNFEKAEKLLEKNINYEKLLEKINNYLEKNTMKNIDLSKYNDYFIFSFTQKIIFEKLYNKFETLTGEKFEVFFEKYIKNLNEIKNIKQESKNFLNNLELFLENK